MTRPSSARFLSVLGLVATMVVGARAGAQEPGAAAPSQSAATNKVPVSGMPATVDDWSDALWNAARTGDRRTVDMLLANVPEGMAADRVAALREAVAQRSRHMDESKAAAATARADKLKELGEAVAAGNPTKALVAAAYLKYLSSDWKVDLQGSDVQSAVALAEKTIEDAQKAGDWLYAEELLNRLRTLHEGTSLKAQYDKYDDRLELDVAPRVVLVLEYAPRAWYALRKAQYDRLDPKDRKTPFAAFSEKGKDDWKNALEGVNERILGEALSQVAAQHIDAVGWKPLIEGGLGMVRRLVTTPALAENFPALADQPTVAAFVAVIDEQAKAVGAAKAGEVDARTFGRAMAALKAANETTVKLPFEAVVREFGNGAMATLNHVFEDPYTEIFWPDRLRRFNQMIKGNFVGVGVLIRHNEAREIMIVNPLDGSPAKRAGAKPGDKIAAVNGVSTADWPLDRAVDTITGPAGTKVTLTLTREGEDKAIEMPLVREKIKMYSVQGWRKTGYNDRSEPQWDWFVNPSDGIGYVRLTGFNEDTFADFARAIADMKSQHRLNGLVLDLRGNPGGLLQSAVAFVNTFVKSGRIVAVEDRNGQELYAFTASRQRAALADLPTVVLINEGSASASEIVSGALEAHDAAVVLGERSFGKGSVQEVHEIGGKGPDAEANVKFTVQHYLLPPKPGEAKGRLVHKRPGSEDWGVIPDYTVKLTPAQMEEINKIRASADDVPEDAADGMVESPAGQAGDAEGKAGDAKPKEKRDPDELIRKGVDPQLEMAVVLLQARALKVQESAARAEKAGGPAPGAPAKGAQGAAPAKPVGKAS
jgi:carboxyl-terminal processing protease